MKLKTRRVLRTLRRLYPDAVKPTLRYGDTFQLAAAVLLSAQTTDKRVNEVTEFLFARFPGPQELAEADAAEVEKIIKPLGLAAVKAKYLQGLSRALLEKFEGRVPATREELMSLPGIGRKSANVILSIGFGKPAFAVDTHVGRVCRRLGLAAGETPQEIEKEVTALLPTRDWLAAHLLIIRHGREICRARSPRCERCALAELCSFQQRRKTKVKRVVKEE